VGGSENRGVVAAVMRPGIWCKSAMSGFIAKKNCPDLIFVSPRFDRYKEISIKFRVFLEYTDMVEPLSLDEAYLDVTQNKKGNQVPAFWQKNDCVNEVGLTASAGISVNKFVAKIASDYNKPNGQKTVNPEDVIALEEPFENFMVLEK
jgi:DNA polymerase-4